MAEESISNLKLRDESEGGVIWNITSGRHLRRRGGGDRHSGGNGYLADSVSLL